MLTIAAIILDFDGLIVDTESPIFDLWSELYREQGHELRIEDWQSSLGTHLGFDPYAHLGGLTGRALDKDALAPGIRARHIERCRAQPLLPGVRELLRDARALDLKTAVASSSSRGWVEGWLTHHGIGPLFDCTCVRDDVTKVKPAPDLFLLAAARLGVVPAQCLVFEDSANGVLAARGAGMRCVAVPNGVTRRTPMPDPDLTLASLAERPLRELLIRLSAPIA